MRVPGAVDPAWRDEVGELPYRIACKALGVRAGAHRSRGAGTGGPFRDLAPFLASPDPRRIDLSRSLRDPFEALHVRRFENTASLDIVLLADVSGSMAFNGTSNKLATIAALADVLARSARRIGDRFGFMAADGAVRENLTYALTRARGSEDAMLSALLEFQPDRTGWEGLVEAANELTGRNKLVILVSDFYLPESALKNLFEGLQRHHVIPILLSDTRAAEDLPRWGLVTFEDLETGKRRTVLMRPSYKAAIVAGDKERKAKLRAMTAGYGWEPFEIEGRIDWPAFGARLAGGR